jgi:hypothetical protein
MGAIQYLAFLPVLGSIMPAFWSFSAAKALFTAKPFTFDRSARLVGQSITPIIKTVRPTSPKNVIRTTKRFILSPPLGKFFAMFSVWAAVFSLLDTFRCLVSEAVSSVEACGFRVLPRISSNSASGRLETDTVPPAIQGEESKLGY